jgi:4-diphosphocytidyl-2-C-methyl-D-erythritol kinase
VEVQRLATDTIVVHTPAKLNLLFEVLGKRADGYHEIVSLMCPISLYDTLILQPRGDGRLDLQCRLATLPCSTAENVGANRQNKQDAACADILPAGPSNLVLRAMETLRRRCGTSHGANVVLIKRIPLAAGLGGGSSDAAAALVAANLAWSLRLPQDQLMAAAAELGSDVPFFLVGGAAVCRGRGERIERVDVPDGWHFVVVRPTDGLSTAAVYGVCKPAEEPRSPRPLVEAMRRGDARQLGRQFYNRLQPAAAQLSPSIERLRGVFASLDVCGHAMSGSGTSYFGLCRHARHARRLAQRLRAGGWGRVSVVHSCR